MPRSPSFDSFAPFDMIHPSILLFVFWMVSALAFRPQSKLVLPRTVHIPLYGTETTSGIRSSLGGSSFQQYGLDCISGRTLALTLLPAAIFNGINIKPALAAGLASILPSGQALASTQDLRALIEARRAPAARTGLLHKIFFGVNASGKLGTWRAGDTRTDVSMLINGLSMLAILGVWAAGAYIFQKREEYLGLRNLRREVEREQEYRESMYFDAVEDIQRRLGDPKTKSGARAGLQRQLKELDPDGRIRDFLSGKTDTKPQVQRPVSARDRNKRGGSGRQQREQSSADQGTMEATEAADEDDGMGYGGVRETGVRGERGDALAGPGQGRGSSDRGSPVPGSTLFDRDAMVIGTDASRVLEVLERLDAALTQAAVPAADRERVAQYLLARFEEVYPDPSKRRAALERVKARLGDLDYWRDLADKLRL